MSQNKNNRLYYMDLLRGWLMTLGVVLHSMAIFNSDQVWKVSSSESVSYAPFIIDFIHVFRMPAFFMIAGFFSILVISKQGEMNYMRDRFTRLGLPLIIAGIMFNLSLAPFINNGVQGGNWWEYIYTGEWLGHLWFLGTLILYSIILSVVWPYLEKFTVGNSKTLFIWIIVLSLIYPVTLRIGWFLEANKIHLIFLSTSNLFQYFPFFLIGAIFFQNQKNINLGGNVLWWATASIFLYFLKDIPSFVLIRNILEFLFICSCSFLLFSIFEKFFSKPKKWKSDFAESSYTVYLVHQPIIILLSFYIIESSLNVHLQLLSILSITSLLAFIIHFKLVNKSSFLLLMFNGKRVKRIQGSLIKN